MNLEFQKSGLLRMVNVERRKRTLALNIWAVFSVIYRVPMTGVMLTLGLLERDHDRSNQGVPRQRIRRDRIEYALIASLVAVAIIGSVTAVGTKVKAVFNEVASNLK